MLGNNTEGCKLDHIRNIGTRNQNETGYYGREEEAVLYFFFVFFRILNGVNIFRYLGKVRERDLAARRSLRTVIRARRSENEN